MSVNSALYPLRFQPLLKRYLWGGRRLATLLGKPLGERNDYAESWEVADHGQDQSVVASGPLAGKTLRELVAQRGPELLGRHAPQARFPLIFKYLDCNQVLSVQVHPDDARGALLNPPDLGKTEAWLILDAQPGSVVYAGLQPGISRAALARAIERDEIESCLAAFQPRIGDCYFIPAGTVHALGAGLLVAEIQQASDTTYRLHDWGRRGPDGQPRKLHLAEALEAIDEGAPASGPLPPQSTNQQHVQRLAGCDKFVLDRWQLERATAFGGDNRFHIVSVLEGELGLPGESQEWLGRGQTVLLPASIGRTTVAVRGRCTFLDMYVP